MGRFIDLTGKRFGRLVVKKILCKNKYGTYIWECQCDCGNIKEVTTGNLKNKNRKR